MENTMSGLQPISERSQLITAQPASPTPSSVKKSETLSTEPLPGEAPVRQRRTIQDDASKLAQYVQELLKNRVQVSDLASLTIEQQVKELLKNKDPDSVVALLKKYARGALSQLDFEKLSINPRKDPVVSEEHYQNLIDTIKREQAGDPLTLIERQAQSTEALKKIEAIVESNKEGKNKKEVISDWELCDILSDAINNIDNSYKAPYEYIMAKFNEFFSKFSNFRTQLSQCVNSGKDGKLEISALAMYMQVGFLLDEYGYKATTPPDCAILYPSPDYVNSDQTPVSKAQAEAWAKEMGLPESCVKPGKNGNWCCTVDLSPLIEIRDSVERTFGLKSEAVVDPAQYQAWVSGFDMQVDKYQNFLQTMMQKYTTANSTFDNLVKVLSSTVTALAECDKTFLTQ